MRHMVRITESFPKSNDIWAFALNRPEEEDDALCPRSICTELVVGLEPDVI